MAQWSNTDSLTGAPKWKSIATGSGTPNRGNTLFANITSGAFINGVSIGTFGTSTAEAQALSPRMVSPGWLKTTVGTGPVVSLTVAGGAGYVNGATVMVSNGTANAAAVITTNAAGNAASAVVNVPGFGFINTATVVTTSGNKWATAIANSTGGTGAGAFNITGVVGYVNGNIITVSGANCFVNAVANITSTNATGGNFTLVIVNRGSFLSTIANQAFTYTITPGTAGVLGNTVTTMLANTTLANATALASVSGVTLGGKAGRIQREPLVAMRGRAPTGGTGSTTP